MNLEPVDCGMTLLVLKTVSSCLLSWDKFQVVSGKLAKIHCFGVHSSFMFATA